MKTLKQEFKEIGFILSADAEKFTVADEKEIVVFETSSLPKLKRFYKALLF